MRQVACIVAAVTCAYLERRVFPEKIKVSGVFCGVSGFDFEPQGCVGRDGFLQTNGFKFFSRKWCISLHA